MKQRNENACERVRPWLSTYADGELNKKQTAAVQKHVRSCPSCAKELAVLDGMTALLRETVEHVEPSATLHDSIMRAISEMPRTATARTARYTVLKRVSGALACLGCLAVIGVAVMLGGANQKDFDAMSPEADSAPDNGGYKDAVTEDCDAPYDSVPTEPSSPPMESEKPTHDNEDMEQLELTTYVLDRISGVGDALDGVWECDRLQLSVASDTSSIKVWFARESSRQGRYVLTDNELTVCFEDGESMRFDWKMEEDTLWLTRKE